MTLPRVELRIPGHSVCRGVAIGSARLTGEIDTPVVDATIAASALDDELARLDLAVERALRQLARLGAHLALLPALSQAELAPLLDAYRQMLGRSRLLRAIHGRITSDLVTAETAVRAETEAAARAMCDLPSVDRTDAERRADEVQEVGRRLLRNLVDAPFRKLSAMPRGAILVADRLRPAEIALIDPTRVAGVVTDEGGVSDHTAVMLASLGIPALVAAAGVTAAVRDGEILVLDGNRGAIVIAPTEATLTSSRADVAATARERQRLGRLRRLPAVLASGEPVELQANLEYLGELPLIAQAGAAGIGLLRTEFLFADTGTLPDERTQADAYAQVVRAMAGDPVTIRLLDWGGEKDSPALREAGMVGTEREPNPALGLRGLRLLLARPALLETQLAALLAVAALGPIRILLPMVTSLSELRETRTILERVARRRRVPRARLPPLGVMIETPGAAIMADALALDADFLSIGTNDLTMYALAVDRASTEIASLYDPLHPAVLRLIATTVEAALALRRPVSICGEMAADPALSRLLLGLGLRSFSVNATALPRIKHAIRHAELDDCVRLARRALALTDTATVAALLR